MITRILVAIDASERAPAVFAAAAEIARKFDAKVWLLRVVDVPPEFPPAAHVAARDPLPAQLARNVIDELTAYVEGNLDIEIDAPVLAFGAKPWPKILETSDAVDADLIVIGSHGYDALDRLIGTTAGAVANRAHRNVLVVHAGGAALRK